jgi:type VI secretion system secreted protein VgrG
LAGVQSKEYAADGFNQWVIDDMPGQLRQRMASSYAASQVNIGYLIRQDGNTRSAYRGLGFELTSDAWGMLRAARGLFVSTTQRAGAVSTQLDMQEAQGKLQSASQLAGALSDAAVQHQASALATPGGVQALRKAIDGKDSADGQQAPRFEQPVALFDSAAGVATTTPASSVLFAGQDLTLTAASALRMTAGQTATMVSAKSMALFTHADGAKVIATKESVSLRAHTGPMDLIADQAMTLTSSNGSIRVQAKQEVLLASGGGYVRLAGGNVDIHCPASVSVKGTTHDFLGAGSVNTNLPELPRESISNSFVVSVPLQNQKYSQQIDIGKMIFNDPELIGADYEIWTKGIKGRMLAKGKIDSSFRSVRVFTEFPENLEIIVGENEWISYAHYENNYVDSNGGEQ